MYNFFSEEALLNPYPLFAQIRSENPVCFLDDINCWMVTRYQDVDLCLRSEKFSSNRSVLLGRSSVNIHEIPNLVKFVSNLIVEKDPPEHTLQRHTVQPVLLKNKYEQYLDAIKEITENLLRNFKSQVSNDNQLEIVNNFFKYIPALVFLKLCDVSEIYADKFLELGAYIIRFWECMGNTDDKSIIEKAEKSADFIINFFSDLITARKNNLGNDIISDLILAYSKAGIDSEKLAIFCAELFVAGNANTIDAMSNGLYNLLNNENQLEILKGNFDLLPSAIEEMLRFDTPGPIIFRVAKDDVKIGNTVIAKGDVVALAIGSANRDPEKFNEAENFNILRTPNEHLSFAKGNHFCLGHVLARLEMNIAFKSLLKAMPNLKLDRNRPPVSKRQNLIFKGLSSLHVVV